MALGADKIVFILKSHADGQPLEREMEIHYTLHGGARSGVLDLHETRTAPDGQKSHRTLFALRTGDLAHLLQQLAPMVVDLLGLVRPLRLGWMARKGIGIARGVDPVSDLDITPITRKRKRRLILDPCLYEQNIFVPKYLEQVYEFPDGQFTLFIYGGKLGLGSRRPMHRGIFDSAGLSAGTSCDSATPGGRGSSMRSAPRPFRQSNTRTILFSAPKQILAP